MSCKSTKGRWAHIRSLTLFAQIASNSNWSFVSVGVQRTRPKRVKKKESRRVFRELDGYLPLDSLQVNEG